MSETSVSKIRRNFLCLKFLSSLNSSSVTRIFRDIPYLLSKLSIFVYLFELGYFTFYLLSICPGFYISLTIFFLLFIAAGSKLSFGSSFFCYTKFI